MWTPLVVLALSLQYLSPVHSQPNVCDIADDNQSAADACAMKKATGGSALFQQFLPSYSPKGALYVQYGNVVVGGAQQLAPSRVFSKPLLSLSLVNGFTSILGIQLIQKKLALACFDFTPQTRAVKLIWLQTGFTADRNSGQLTSSSSPLVPYISPNPASGTGTHEYVFLAIRDNEGVLPRVLGQKVNPGGQSLVSLDLKSFLSSKQLKDHLIAISFFKSTFDGQLIGGQTPSALARKQANVAAVHLPSLIRRLDQSAAVTPDTNSFNASADAVDQPSLESSTTVENSTFNAVTDATSVQTHQNLTQDAASNSTVIVPQSTLLSNGTLQPEISSNVSSQSLDVDPPTPSAQSGLTSALTSLLQPADSSSTNTTSDSDVQVSPVTNSLNISICSYESAAAQDACDMASAFEGSSLISNVVPTFQPIGGLYVQYGDVVLGGAEQMSPSRVAIQPTVMFTPGVPDYVISNKKYLLLLVDNFVGSSAVSVSWAQTGITIDSTTGVLVSPDDEPPLCSYIRPNPSLGTPPRNYVFLLFEQPAHFAIPTQYKNLLNSSNADNHDSLTFNMSSFCTESGLVSPVGGNFFISSVTHQNARRSAHHSLSRS